MTVADKNFDALPQANIDTTAFNGTAGTGWDTEEDITNADRGDSLEQIESETPTEPEAEPEELVTEEPTEPELDEGEVEAIETDADKSPKKTHTVPYERFRKENQRRKELEARLAEVEKNRPEYTAPDMALDFKVSVDQSKFKAMSDAFLEGDAEVAQQMFTEMLSDNVNAAAVAAAKAASQQAYETARNEAESSHHMRELVNEAQQAAEIVMAEYDVFNDQSESFNKDVFDEALRIRDGLIQAGYGVGEAILEAAEITTHRHGIVAKSKQNQSPPEQPKVKKPDVKAKMTQAEKNPPRTGGERAGDAPTIDVFTMTVDEFEKLDPKEVARLRGDFV